MPRPGDAYDRYYVDDIEGSTYQVVNRWDMQAGDIRRFVVQLEKRISATAPTHETIAQIDHDPDAPGGHDLYGEGLHVDIYQDDGGKRQSTPRHGPLPRPTGALLTTCGEYLKEHAGWCFLAHIGAVESDEPPNFF